MNNQSIVFEKQPALRLTMRSKIEVIALNIKVCLNNRRINLYGDFAAEVKRDNDYEQRGNYKKGK